jgi:hypothetical protein
MGIVAILMGISFMAGFIACNQREIIRDQRQIRQNAETIRRQAEARIIGNRSKP